MNIKVFIYYVENAVQRNRVTFTEHQIIFYWAPTMLVPKTDPEAAFNKLYTIMTYIMYKYVHKFRRKI